MHALYIIRYTAGDRRVRFYVGITRQPAVRYEQHRTGRGAACLRGCKLDPMHIITDGLSHGEALRLEHHYKSMIQRLKRRAYEHEYIAEIR